MKLALGTAQFGMNYGISNSTGKINPTETKEILALCRTEHISTIDTAQVYGESETVLGNSGLEDFDVITKITDKDNNIEMSLERLKLPHIYAILMHNENEMNEKNYMKLENYKSQGLVQKIGVSVYSPTKLEIIMTNYKIDIVQIPLNILDQRFLPLLPKLKEKGIEVHIRSVFLQGLLLMENIPDYFNSIKPMLNKMPKDRLGFCLHFVKNIEEVDKIVIGVTSKNELQQIICAYNKKTFDFSEYMIDDEKIVNPSLWSLSTWQKN
jgi:aryl-alcohol dehydrogenase-like predicted oxidoreductase